MPCHHISTSRLPFSFITAVALRQAHAVALGHCRHRRRGANNLMLATGPLRFATSCFDVVGCCLLDYCLLAPPSPPAAAFAEGHAFALALFRRFTILPPINDVMRRLRSGTLCHFFACFRHTHHCRLRPPLFDIVPDWLLISYDCIFHYAYIYWIAAFCQSPFIF